jgi:hypothetical protein
MSATPWHDDPRPQADQPAAPDGDTYFVEVTVYAGILLTTADTIDLLHDFFTESDAALRGHLGRFLITRDPDADTGDPGVEANIVLHELTEVTDLLRTLAGYPDDESVR